MSDGRTICPCGWPTVGSNGLFRYGLSRNPFLSSCVVLIDLPNPTQIAFLVAITMTGVINRASPPAPPPSTRSCLSSVRV